MRESNGGQIPGQEDWVKAGIRKRVARSVIRFLSGLLIVEKRHTDKGLAAFRWSRCEGCSNRVEGRCGICKCPLEIKIWTVVNRNWKTGQMELTHCPDGKWGDQHLVELFTNQKL